MCNIKNKGLTSNQIKLIAIGAMLIDHIAWRFVPMESCLSLIMHTIGRITGPTMCFFIVEGYYNTKDYNKYLKRLAIFALVSQIPFNLFMNGDLFNIAMINMIYTLTLCLLVVRTYDKYDESFNRKIRVIILLILSAIADWAILSIIFTIIFINTRNDNQKRFRYMSNIILIMFSIEVIGMFLGSVWIGSAIIYLGIYLALLLLKYYNGERGGSKNSKWFFYIFYPLHLLILGAIKFWV